MTIGKNLWRKSNVSENLTTEEKIKKFKEQSEFCLICGKKVLFNGASINLVSITEGGKVVQPYETEDQSMGAIVPLCPYHMILAQCGVIAMTTQNQIIHARRLSEFEAITDAALRLKSKINRNSKILQEEAQLAKAIIDARKMQTEMDKQEEEMKIMQEESACEEHKNKWTRECEKCLNTFKEKSQKKWEESIK